MRRRIQHPRPRHNYANTLIKQIIICIVFVLLAILVKKMDIAIVNQTMETIKMAASKDYTGAELLASIKDTAQKAKTVPAFMATTFKSGEEKLAFSPPTDEAAVVSTFGEKTIYFEGEKNGFSRGMTFSSNKELQVHAVSGGTVTDVKESSLYGQYIKIEHENGITSLYGGCTEIYVEPLDKVKKGQIIAAIAPGKDNLLNFELWVDQKVVNPADYIKF